MKRLKFWIKLHPLVAALIGVAVFAGSGLAAFLILTGVDGSGQGSFATAQAGGAAVTITPAGTWSLPLDSGTTQQYPITATNNTTGPGGETVDTITATFTTKDVNGSDDTATCGPYLSLQGWTLSANPIGFGQSTQGTVNIALGNAAPVSCAGGTWLATFSGSTTP